MKTIFMIIILGMANAAFGQSDLEISSQFKTRYTLELDSNYTEAASILEAVYDPDSYMLNARLGWLNYLAADYPASIKYYLKAIELLPYAIEPRLGYALPLSALGNWNEVISTYEHILSIDPQNTLANYRLGSIYYYRAEYDKAYSSVEKVVNLYPFDYDAVILFAWINLQRGDYRKAEILFNKSLLIRPDDASATEGLTLIK